MATRLAGALALAAAAAAPRSPPANRTIRLVNNCAAPGFVTITDGFGSSHPAPSGGSYLLPAGAVTELVWLPPFASDDVWSGNIGMCANGTGGVGGTGPATCAGSQVDCAAGRCGMADGGPQTRAEFTLSAGAGSDFYDVTVINGASIATAIVPSQGGGNASQPYHCGSPGAGPIANWSFVPPSPYYQWVLSGGAPCNVTADCSVQGEVCGLSRSIGQTPQFALTCGPSAGWWTGDEVCGDTGASFGAPFDCAAPISNGPGANETQWTYYGCVNGISSCYAAGAPTTCCGCVDWWQHGVAVPPAPLTSTCVATNPEWVELMLPRLLWAKAACPTCYTYPFDDMSSTFTCDTQPVYTVAFCGAG